MSVLVSVLMSCAQPPVSSSIFLTYVNSSSGNSGTTFVAVMSRLALWTLSPRWNRAWNVTFPSFLSGSNLLVVPVISIVGGAPVVSSLLFMVAICQSCYSPLSVVAVLVLFFVCVLPLGWLGVIIIVLFFVLRATPWLARGYYYCFVFCLRATPWLVRGYDYCLGFCFTCHPLAG